MKKNSMKKSKDSLARRKINKLLSNKLAIFGFSLFLLMTLLCLLAPLLTPHDPSYIDIRQKYAAPSSEHIFGCDQSGRDLFARLLYGGQVSIGIAMASAILANVLGAILGCISGYLGGKVDQILMYFSEIIACFPNTMLVLIIVGMIGQGKLGVLIMILVFVLTGWVGSMRMIRSRVLSIKQEVFVESLVANGIGKVSIMIRHILPNTMGIFILNITSAVAGYIMSETSLSFLGVGVPKGIPTWGNMMNAARSFTTMQAYPQLWVLPGIAVALFTLGVNFFGDGLRDVFDAKGE